jgi:long-chain acyl-CoA synthetase
MQAVSTSSHSRTPPKYTAAELVNATDDVVRNARVRPAHPAFARRIDGAWRTVTSYEFAEQVAALAAGLLAAGIGPGDRVALMSGTRYEWTLCDFAIWTVGAVTVPVYETSSAAQVAWILHDCGAVAAFAENELYATLVRQARAPRMRHVWRFDAGDLDGLATAIRSVTRVQVERRRRGVHAHDLATIVYTSGTTGRPRGCMITHGEILAEVHNIAHADGIGGAVVGQDTRLLLFLPLAHILARMVALVAVHNGAQVAHTSDLGDLPTYLREYRPTLILAVPRVFDDGATAAVLDPDGWYHTGDLGRLDDGYLTITGRKKDVVITAGGKNVAPALIEDRLRALADRPVPARR